MFTVTTRISKKLHILFCLQRGICFCWYVWRQMDSQVKRKQGVKMTKSCMCCSLLLGDPQNCTVHTQAYTHARSTTGAGRRNARFKKLAHTFSNPLPLSHSPCLPVSLHLCPCTEIAKIWGWGKSCVSIVATQSLLFSYKVLFSYYLSGNWSLGDFILLTD